MFVKYNLDKNLVYDYHYSLLSGELTLSCIYYNHLNEVAGGVDIAINKKIIPIYEEKYGYGKISMKYSIKDFLFNLFK